MNKIKNLSLECNNLSICKITATFHNEEVEREFLHNVAKVLNKEYIVSTLIHDLDVDISLYKNYFQSTDFSIFEDDPTHPFLTCSVLDSQTLESVISNWGYYTLNAYLYWTKDVLDFKSALHNTSDHFFMKCSALTIKQVLDLSVDIHVNNAMFPIIWDVLKKCLTS